MSGFYEAKRDGVAKRLLTKYGTAMQLVQAGTATLDPVTGGSTVGPDVLHKVTGIFEQKLKQRVPGTAQTEDQWRVILMASGMKIVPQQSHKLRVANVDYEIVGVDAVTPGGVDLIYYLIIRAPAGRSNFGRGTH